LLKKRPVGAPSVEETFEIQKVAKPSLSEDGQVLIRILMISVDPYMRGRMNDNKSYFTAPFEVGKPLSGGVAAEVVESRSADLKPGDKVLGFLPWLKYLVVAANTLRKLDTSVVPLEKYLSSAGYSGLSSYLPIKYIAAPKAGETVFVTGGAGAVGSCACQIFFSYGCKVISCAGSAEKVKWLQDLGIEAFNYKECALEDALMKFCPKGIDIYWDNVGGEMLETTLNHMNNFGRVVCCGMISQYNKAPKDRYGIKNLFLVVTKRLKLQGFIMSDYNEEQRVAATKELIRLICGGKLKTTETIMNGFEKVPEAFCGLFTGKNLGKMLVKI